MDGVGGGGDGGVQRRHRVDDRRHAVAEIHRSQPARAQPRLLRPAGFVGALSRGLVAQLVAQLVVQQIRGKLYPQTFETVEFGFGFLLWTCRSVADYRNTQSTTNPFRTDPEVHSEFVAQLV